MSFQNPAVGYHSVSRESAFNPFDIEKIDGLMSANEEIAQHSNKLAAEQMLAEIRREVEALERCAANMPAMWPEFSVHLARIRGYAFLGFRICSAHAAKNKPARPPAPPQRAFTIEDL